VFRFGTLSEKPASVNELHFALAVEKGWFKDAGIDFQVKRMAVNVVYAAIAAGEMDATNFAGSAALASLRGAPLAVVYFPQPSTTWSLVADPKKIKTAKDFSGARCVAGTGAKSGTHIAWAAMIDSVGGNPRDFQSVGTGQPPQLWIEALRVGTAECMMGFDGVWTRQAQREGFKVWAFLPDVMPMQSHGIAVSKPALKDRDKRALIEDMLGVVLRSKDYVVAKENRGEIVATIKRWMGAPKGIENEDYENTVDELAKLYPPKGYIENESIFNNMLVTALKYGIFDPNDYTVDGKPADLARAGAVDQGPLKTAASWGGPLYKRP
jgi:ABC-type nitrate/sulfonate/bicarbonate transport system substrate-binding protein